MPKCCNIFTPTVPRKQAQDLKKENYVAVMIWWPRVAGESTNQYRAAAAQATRRTFGSNKDVGVGHVALQTSGLYVRYASFGPDESETVRHPFRLYQGQWQTDIADDLDYLQRPPDRKVYFYSLAPEVINSEYDNLQEKALGYVAVGDSSLGAGGHNCASIIYHLLKKGGIDEELAPERGSELGSGIVSPRNLDQYIQKAKVRELALYPNTATEAFKQDDNQESHIEPHSRMHCSIL